MTGNNGPLVSQRHFYAMRNSVCVEGACQIYLGLVFDIAVETSADVSVHVFAFTYQSVCVTSKGSRLCVGLHELFCAHWCGSLFMRMWARVFFLFLCYGHVCL